MTKISYGTKTNSEIKLVLNAVVFTWLRRKGRLSRLPQPCSPNQLFNFIVENELGWRGLLDFAGLTEDEIRFFEQPDTPDVSITRHIQ